MYSLGEHPSYFLKIEKKLDLELKGLKKKKEYQHIDIRLVNAIMMLFFDQNHETVPWSF